MPVESKKEMEIKMIVGGMVVDLTKGITTVDLDEGTLYADNVAIEKAVTIPEPVTITLTAEITKVNISDIPPGKHFYYKGAEWLVLEQQHCTTTAIDTSGKNCGIGGNPYFNGEVFKEGTAVTPCIPGCERVTIGDQAYEIADPAAGYASDTEFLGIPKTASIEENGGQTA